MVRGIDLLRMALVGVLLHGCVAIPIPVLESSPTEKVERTITIGQTTRVDILSSIGEPPFIRRKSALFIYQSDRVHAWILLVPPLGGGGAIGRISDSELLAITFDDEGVVRGVERAAALQGHATCLPSGICLGEAGQKTVLLAPSAADAQAKVFATDPEVCTVYLFRDDKEWQLAPNVAIDGENAGALPYDGFMRLRPAPGKHEVLIELFNSFSRKLDCSANHVQFWRVRPVVPWQRHHYETSFYLEPVPPDIDQGGVRKGKLLFGPLD